MQRDDASVTEATRSLGTQGADEKLSRGMILTLRKMKLVNKTGCLLNSTA